MNRVGVIDYGMGNLHSVQKALEAVEAEAEVCADPSRVSQFARLVLPGVGAFGDAMANLRKTGLLEPVLEAAGRGTPLLGICLGMQILFEDSDEMGTHPGLGLLSGSVRRLRVSKRIPHMGWNQLINRKACPLLTGVRDGAFVYFANSYVVQPGRPEVVAAETQYGIPFPSVVWQGNLYGVQFHPEKSQRTGLRILRNFMERC